MTSVTDVTEVTTVIIGRLSRFTSPGSRIVRAASCARKTNTSASWVAGLAWSIINGLTVALPAREDKGSGRIDRPDHCEVQACAQRAPTFRASRTWEAARV